MDNELRDAINKHIHKLMGNCVVKVESDQDGKCTRCGKRSLKSHEPPDYTSSKSPRYLLEDAVAKVKESVGIAAFNRELLKLFVSDYAREVAVLALSAEQISTAIYNATQTEDQNDRPKQ